MFVPEIHKTGILTMHFGGAEAYQIATSVSGEKKKVVNGSSNLYII